MKLFKVYLVYGEGVVLHLYWANTKEDVPRLMEWGDDDKPIPIIVEIEVKEGCVMCHHIADLNFDQPDENKPTIITDVNGQKWFVRFYEDLLCKRRAKG